MNICYGLGCGVIMNEICTFNLVFVCEICTPLIQNLMYFLPLAADVLLQGEEQILHCNMPDTEDGVAYENQDEEPEAMVEESPSDVDFSLNEHGTNTFLLI